MNKTLLGRLLRNRRALSLILSALLMVVIVLIGSTIVYAWSLGIFGQTLPSPAPSKEILTMELYKVVTTREVELLLRNAGSNKITLDRYYVLFNGRLIAQGTFIGKIVNVQATTDVEIEGVNFSVGFAHIIRIVTKTGNLFDFGVVITSDAPPG